VAENIRMGGVVSTRENETTPQRSKARPHVFRNCENMISVPAVEEISYRQSRLCRLLGNPVAFTVVSLLADSKEMSTGEIARAIGRSVPRTSNILGALRLAELVRYETEGRHARYRLKHPLEVRRILDALSGFVKTTSVDQG
jgi:DNA-binding transcriptional ArsR family regulator